jgi:hypothetical protein
VFKDNDNDKFGGQLTTVVEYAPHSAPPSGTSTNNYDCEDDDRSIHPLAGEIPQNGIDENCNGETDEEKKFEDLDQDGFGSTIATEKNGVFNRLDCDDNDAGRHPVRIDVLNGIDDDCDGIVDEPF